MVFSSLHYTTKQMIGTEMRFKNFSYKILKSFFFFIIIIIYKHANVKAIQILKTYLHLDDGNKILHLGKKYLYLPCILFITIKRIYSYPQNVIIYSIHVTVMYKFQVSIYTYGSNVWNYVSTN